MLIAVRCPHHPRFVASAAPVHDCKWCRMIWALLEEDRRMGDDRHATATMRRRAHRRAARPALARAVHETTSSDVEPETLAAEPAGERDDHGERIVAVVAAGGLDKRARRVAQS